MNKLACLLALLLTASQVALADDVIKLAALREAVAAQPYDAELNYQLGVAAYQQQDYLTALEMFERVLALNPNHAGALLDMAITYYEKGDYDEATTLFTRVSSLPLIPRQAAAVLGEYLTKLAERQRPWRQQASFGVALGSSSNANQGLAADTIKLPGNINLVPAEDFRARPDQFADLALDGRTERIWNGRRLYWVGHWRERRWNSEHSFNQRWLLGGVGWVTPLTGRVSLDSSVLAVNGWLGSHTLQSAGYWLNQFTLDNGPMAHWLRLEAGARHFPTDSGFDSRQARLVLGNAYARQNWKVLGEIGLGRDHPTHDRPGGDRQGIDWLLEGGLRVAPGWWLGGQWRAEHERQKSPFAPGIFGGFTRVDHTQLLSVSLVWEPSTIYRWELSALRSRLNSNLDLYDLSRTEWRLEWRRNWR